MAEMDPNLFFFEFIHEKAISQEILILVHHIVVLEDSKIIASHINSAHIINKVYMGEEVFCGCFLLFA